MKLSEKPSQGNEQSDFVAALEGYAGYVRYLENEIDKQKYFIVNAQKEMEKLALFFTSRGTLSVQRATIKLEDFKPAYNALQDS